MFVQISNELAKRDDSSIHFNFVSFTQRKWVDNRYKIDTYIIYHRYRPRQHLSKQQIPHGHLSIKYITLTRAKPWTPGISPNHGALSTQICQIFGQVAVNVAPEHLQFIVCKVWINFFHGIEEFRNLHVLIQILRLCRSRNTKHWNWRKNWIRIKESQWGRDSCRVFFGISKSWPKVIVHALEALGHAFHWAILFAHLFLNAKK